MREMLLLFVEIWTTLGFRQINMTSNSSNTARYSKPRPSHCIQRTVKIFFLHFWYSYLDFGPKFTGMMPESCTADSKLKVSLWQLL